MQRKGLTEYVAQRPKRVVERLSSSHAGTEFVHCSRLPQERDYSMISSLQRRLEHLWSNPCAKKVISPLSLKKSQCNMSYVLWKDCHHRMPDKSMGVLIHISANSRKKGLLSIDSWKS
ncbi:hypothetical protein BsWGS_19096 [Bradybaena similaris]